jgi:hypothetical protein
MHASRFRFPPMGVALLASAQIAACARRDEPAPKPANPIVAVPPQPEVPNIVWQDPPKWQRQEGGSSMRKASYRIAPAEGDPEDAEAAVYYFGRGNGGSTDANIQRWIAQFPDVPPSEVKRLERQANGMKQTVIDIQGTYDGSRMTINEQVKKPHFRMIAAVVETPAGSYFFKLTGPEKTVESARASYFALLDSVNQG